MIEHIDHHHGFGDDETESKPSIVLILERFVHIHRKSVMGNDEVIRIKDNHNRIEIRLSECLRSTAVAFSNFVALRSLPERLVLSRLYSHATVSPDFGSGNKQSRKNRTSSVPISSAMGMSLRPMARHSPTGLSPTYRQHHPAVPSRIAPL